MTNDSQDQFKDRYDHRVGHMSVLEEAIAMPSWMPEAARQLTFSEYGLPTTSQETGEFVELYTAMGTVPLHRDFDLTEGNNAILTMGLVILNESDACLTDGTDRIPLPAGSVFRINPGMLHGTCLPDGSQTETGHFAFLTVDVDMEHDVEDAPEEFAIWALDQVQDKFVSLGLHFGVECTKSQQQVGAPGGGL